MQYQVQCRGNTLLKPQDYALIRSPKDVSVSRLILARQRRLPRKLLLSLLVPMHDQLIEEAAGLALIVTIGLGFVCVFLQVAAGFVVNIVFVIVFIPFRC